MLAKPKRRSRYLNQPTIVDGVRFDSKKEATRYSELKILERAGEISELVLQPKYELPVEGERICNYVGDFAYLDKRTGLRVVEDVKSPRTRKIRAYRIKLKLMKAIHGIEVVEIV